MILSICLLLLSVGRAQVAPDTAPDTFRRTADVSVHRGMWTLNSWAITNMATGVPLSLTVTDPTEAAFHQMNAGWNIVNLGLASTSLIRKQPADPQKLAKIFWINAGLDVGYVAAGLAMAHKGRETNNPQLEGWGNSIALQGGFLFGFDAVMGWRMQTYLR